MIYQLITILVVIAFGALAYYPVQLVINRLLNTVLIPLDIGGPWVSFLTSVVTWWLLIGVLLPLLVWVIYQSQKPRLVLR